MTTEDLFDAEESQRLKEEGMAVATISRAEGLAIGKQIAKEIAMQRGYCHADLVGRVLKEKYGIDSLGPAAGSLFKGKDWEFTGRRVPSSRITNHGRDLKVWRLVR